MSPISTCKAAQIDFRKDPLAFKAAKHDLAKGISKPLSTHLVALIDHTKWERFFCAVFACIYSHISDSFMHNALP